jgi:c(7)-type cytochrome triheme protein
LKIPFGAHLGSIAIAAVLLCTPAHAAGEPILQLAYLRVAPGQIQSDADHTHAPVEQEIPAARKAIDSVNFLDENNPDRHRLQRIEEATRHLPYDANGFPDWMKALNKGLIKPRAGLSEKDRMEVLDLDIVMRNTKEMPFVKFPHRSHTEWLACANCHPDPFPTQAGASEIRMANIFRGQFCGKCHDRVAFVTFFSCDRCHSQPQKNFPKR